VAQEQQVELPINQQVEQIPYSALLLLLVVGAVLDTAEVITAHKMVAPVAVKVVQQEQP
jgi:hypothetical protein